MWFLQGPSQLRIQNFNNFHFFCSKIKFNPFINAWMDKHEEKDLWLWKHLKEKVKENDLTTFSFLTIPWSGS